MSELVIVPPHLLERIRQILATDLELPEDLRADLQAGLDRSSSELETEVDESKSQRPLTIDIDVLERLSRWVNSDDRESTLQTAGLGKSDQSTLILLPDEADD